MFWLRETEFTRDKSAANRSTEFVIRGTNRRKTFTNRTFPAKTTPNINIHVDGDTVKIGLRIDRPLE